MEGLKEKVIRGGAAKLCGQAVVFFLRIGFIAVMARLLSPEDFGLVAMVVAVTSFYDLFTTAGLSLAAVQRASITEQQVSSLFWMNLLVGAALFLVCAATAPLLVRFYGEPRLFWVSVALGAGFFANAAGVQHSAQLQRQMRYIDLTIIEVVALLGSCVLGIVLALAGYGYWSLVGSTIAMPVFSSALMWIVGGWLPRWPTRSAGIRSMLTFGGTVTLNNLIIYFAYNLDKILIGRVWGAAVLGVYGTAYQLVNVPTRNLTGALGGVAFSALARLQNEPDRLKSYFLRGHFLLVSATAPVTIFSCVYADDIVLVILGQKWAAAADIFRLLTPTILVFSMINPTGWLLQSIGLQMRSLWIATVIAPLVIAGYVAGLPYGSKGVAFGFSAAMSLWLVPHVFWALKGTMISPKEFFFTTSRPMIASLLSAALAYGASRLWLDSIVWPFVRLALAGTVMAVSYLYIVMFVMGEKSLYLDLLKGLRRSPPAPVINPE